MHLLDSEMDAYSGLISRQAHEASSKLEAFIDSLDFSGTYYQKKESRNAVIEFMQVLVGQYGDASAAIAADFYNEIAESAGVNVSEAVMAQAASDASVAGSVRYNAKKIFGKAPDAEAFKRACVASLSRFIKKAANDTMSQNAVRDGNKGAKFARIPQGSETCGFCIMLASRGFVYASRESAGDFNHFHDFCDCKIIVGFGDPSIAGYDPDGLYKKWRDSPHADYMKDRARKETEANYEKFLRKLKAKQ